MLRRAIYRLSVLFLVVAGIACAGSRPVPAPVGVTQKSATTMPSGISELTLDQIEPRAKLPPTPPARVGRPPIDAVVAYASARRAVLEDRRADAVNLLEQAVSLDPDSYALHYELAKAYKGSLAYEVRSMAELETACAMDPQRLEARLDLARQYASRGDAPKAIEHFRLALQTPAYLADDPRALEADLFLSQALATQGYDRAALERCEKALERLADRGLPRRLSADPPLFQLAGRLYLLVGDLYMKRGDPAQALAAYEAGAEDSGDFEVEQRIVRALLGLRRMSDAATRAANAVARHQASAESVALLREVYRAVGRESDAAKELAHLHQAHPEDRPLLFALADTLAAEGKSAEADRLLATAADRSPADAELVRRRVATREAGGDLIGAAGVLIESTAVAPDLVGELEESWARLLRPENRDRLTLADLQSLPLPEKARPAKAFALARAAVVWPRSSLARTSLAEAVRLRPLFPPAFRERLRQIWDDDAIRAETKLKQSEALIDAAEQAGEASLAAELRGRVLLARDDIPNAASAIADAVKLDGSLNQSTPASRPSTAPSTRAHSGLPPDLTLVFAESLLAFDNAPSFEKVMWKLLQDHPYFGQGYATLHSYYRSKKQQDQAERVLTAWRKAEPRGLVVRLTQSRELLRAGRFDAAETILAGLRDDFGDEPEVLAALSLLYGQTNRRMKLQADLEERVAAQPKRFESAQRLIRTYLAVDRDADASRLLDSTRLAAAGEPDVLYTLSHLYNLAGQKEVGAQVLEDVLKLDPAHPSAANDLGYYLADLGRDLARAESLVRLAVSAEPESSTMLDSLGWILYKRGDFAAARETLERALASTPDAPPGNADLESGPDPVLLDHLGDICYRQGDKPAAARAWEQSRRRLDAMGEAVTKRDDLRPLKLQLEQKQRQLKAGEPVSVAPIPSAETRPTGTGSGVSRQAGSRK